MKRLVQYIAPFLLLASSISACGSAPETVALPTVTPLQASAAPQFAPVNFQIDSNADLQKAKDYIEQEQFSQAALLINHAEQDPNTNAQALTEELYLAWSQSFLKSKSFSDQQYDLAREKLVQGLAQVDSSSVLQDAFDQLDSIQLLIAKQKKLQELYQQGSNADAQPVATELLETLNRLGDLDSFSFGPQLTYDSYLLVGDVYRANKSEEDALNAYRLAARVQGVNTDQAQANLVATPVPTARPTARPAPQPTAVPTRVVPDVRGSDPINAQNYLQSLGFQVALTQITDPSQLGGLCKQMVSYTAPAGGQNAPIGSLVRIFYRGFDNHKSPANCPPGR